MPNLTLTLPTKCAGLFVNATSHTCLVPKSKSYVPKRAVDRTYSCRRECFFRVWLLLSCPLDAFFIRSTSSGWSLLGSGADNVLHTTHIHNKRLALVRGDYSLGFAVPAFHPGAPSKLSVLYTGFPQFPLLDTNNNP
jgi:hypothetical protein